MGISLPTLYRWARDNPNFPRLRKLGPRTTVISDDEIDAYMASVSKLPAGFNHVAAEVDALKAEKERVTAEFRKTLQKIHERLAKLECIEHTPAETAGEH